jgi:hypothetical protein
MDNLKYKNSRKVLTPPETDSPQFDSLDYSTLDISQLPFPFLLSLLSPLYFLSNLAVTDIM